MYMAGQFVGDIQRRNRFYLVVRVQDPLGPDLPGTALQFLARESRFDSRRLPNGDIRTTTSYTTPLSIVRLDRASLPRGTVPAQAMLMFRPRRSVYTISFIGAWPFVKFTRFVP
jgi:hypothetical protein